MDTSTTPPNPPKALPKPESKTNSINFFTLWQGLGLQALLSIGIVIVFLVLLPWIFPGLQQSLPKINDLEKKVQNIEHQMTQLPTSSTSDLSQIHTQITQLEQKLEQKLQDQGGGHEQEVTSNLQKVIQLGYLLRLEAALGAGEEYEKIFEKLISVMHLNDQDFPVLKTQQKTGVKSLPQIINQWQEVESETTSSNLPNSEELPHQVLSRFLKIRKHPQNKEKPQESMHHQILILLQQNKIEEAYETAKKMDEKEIVALRQDLHNLINGRQEVEKLWQAWEGEISPKTDEEKGE